MISGYSNCEKCPLKDCPPVYGYGKPGGLVILGEAPGKDEVLKGQPFVGKSGRLLRDTLKVLGVNPEDVYFTNACLCRPQAKVSKDGTTDTAPKPAAVAACNDRLIEELAHVNPQKILIAGGVALQALTTPGKAAPITKSQGMGMWVTFGNQTVIGEEDLVDIPYEVFSVPTYHPAAVLKSPDLFRDFANDIFKLVNNKAPKHEPIIDLWVCENAKQALEQLDILHSADHLSCDLECTGFSPMQDTIMSIGFGALFDDQTGYSVIIPKSVADNPNVKKAIKSLLTSQATLVLHNLKYDMQFIHKWYEEQFRLTHPKDTMLMVYAQDERGTGAGGGRGYQSTSLKTQVRIRYDQSYGFDFEKFLKIPEEERDYPAMYEYQGKDVYYTLRLYFDLLDELDKESPKLLPLIENLLVPAAVMFTEVEQTGIPLDIPYMQDLLVEKKAELEILDAQLIEQAKGVGVEDFNTGHIKVKKVLNAMGFYPPNTQKTTLTLLAEDPNLSKIVTPQVYDFIKLLIQDREVDHVIGTYIEGVLNRMGPDGRVRPDVLIHGADTGRLSYRDPNPQNQPLLMGPIIRDGYAAPEGYKLLIADYSQLELRVAAWYSQDPTMIKIFKDGRDIHSEAAIKVFKKPADQITKGERYAAKCLNFGVIYGRGAKSLVEGIEARILATEYNQVWTLKEAEDILKGVLASFPKFRDWIKSQHQFVHKYKYVESATGRRRRFPLIPTNYAGDIERRAVNTPIQGLASDLNLDSAIQVHDRLPHGAWVLFLVHDSIMVLCKDPLVDQVASTMKAIMTAPRLINPGDILFKVDIDVGQKWGHMKGWEGA
jgi:DNA polymerase-1